MKKHSKKLFSLCFAAMALSGITNPAFANPADNEDREMTMVQQQKKSRTVPGTITDAVPRHIIVSASLGIDPFVVL